MDDDVGPHLERVNGHVARPRARHGDRDAERRGVRGGHRDAARAGPARLRTSGSAMPAQTALHAAMRSARAPRDGRRARTLKVGALTGREYRFGPGGRPDGHGLRPTPRARGGALRGHRRGRLHRPEALRAPGDRGRERRGPRRRPRGRRPGRRRGSRVPALRHDGPGVRARRPRRVAARDPRRRARDRLGPDGRVRPGQRRRHAQRARRGARSRVRARRARELGRVVRLRAPRRARRGRPAAPGGHSLHRH